MGEVSDMMLDGTLCQTCGEYLGDGDGYPVTCPGCKVDTPARPSKNASKKWRAKHRDGLISRAAQFAADPSDKSLRHLLSASFQYAGQGMTNADAKKAGEAFLAELSAGRAEVVYRWGVFNDDTGRPLSHVSYVKRHTAESVRPKYGPWSVRRGRVRPGALPGTDFIEWEHEPGRFAQHDNAKGE